MNWNCAFTEERLSEYLEGSLAAEEREACAAHAAMCAKCAEMLDRVGALIAGMHALEPVEEPAFLARRIIRNTAGSATPRHELATIAGWFNLIWQPRFAMGIATVAATFVILVHAAGGRLNSLKPGDLNPVNWVREGNRQAHLTYARGEKFVNDLRVVYEIRAVLAAPQPQPSAPQNQAAPAPSGTRPDTGEHNTPEFEREAIAPTASGHLDWAMLGSAFEGVTPDPANRRGL